jgi:hypothetical protein
VLFDQFPENIKRTAAGSVSSKKRAAAGSKESLPTALSPTTAQAQTPRAGDVVDEARTHSASRMRGSLGPMAPNVGFDLDTSFRIDDFPSSIQGMSPLDLTMNPVEPIPVGQIDPGHHLQQDDLGQGLNHINQLDAVMFPSEDPLAYPNQPGLGIRGGPQHYDPSQYYAPNLFDGIEGQLMGPLPPYLMQTSHGPPGFSFPAQMYSDPMLAIQLQRTPQHQPQGHQPMPQQTQRRRMFNQFGAQQSWSGGMFPQ